MKKRIISLILCIVMCFSIVATLAGCGKRTDAFVIMSEELDGLFNPFFSTTAADGTIVSMTQIGMLSTAIDENENVKVAYGDDYAVATLAYESKHNPSAGKTGKGQTTYTFVIKNGIKFSDGKPLTIEDVLFNMYVYLDPVYTGSSTMYSTDILGLQEYRTQIPGASDSISDSITSGAAQRAENRIKELLNLFIAKGDPEKDGTYDLSIDDMKTLIGKHSVSNGYKSAISADTSKVTNQQLLEDYNKALEYFKEELEDDYVAAQDAYDLTKAPYSEWKNYFDNEVFRFMYYEGFVEVKYEEIEGGKENKNKIISITPQYSEDVCKDKASAINYVYNSKVSSELNMILSYWATASRLRTEYAAQATEVILREQMKGDELAVKNISGIVSLGHTTDVEKVTVDGKEYKVAHEHNEDGTPKNADEYDVLEVTINGVDPKAVWNFAFSVAPQHYYAPNQTVDIKNNKFGVQFGTFSFMTDEIQAVQHNKIPVGAGAYKATNKSNSDNPGITEFFSDNVVYFKANNYFEESFGEAFHVNIDKIRYQVVSTSNALNALEAGTIHYATPQLTDNNIDKLNSLKKEGLTYTSSDQLGYGYIGINAGMVENINLRRAIMSAMDTALAIEYYRDNTASTIYWPMSKVSWAYPSTKDEAGEKVFNVYPEDQDYIDFTFNDSEATEKIQKYMKAAGAAAGDSRLKIKFTIAGSNVSDHPTYSVFQKAAKLLNECGWEIEVIADSQALTKLSTGSLAVWAAAWGSTIDPDMYQVYHKNSTATSVLAWGYDDILANPGKYKEETTILNKLSAKIDEAREIEDREDRAELYQEAMSYVLDLAVEMPVYQRKVLYAYNSDVIDSSSLPETINPYSSPLDRIWEVKYAEGVVVTEDGNSGLGIGAIIGIIAGCLVVAGGAVAAVIILKKKKGGKATEGAVAISDDDITIESDSDNSENNEG
ncbi:MAG: hypothetical protein IJD79_10275 [Clostridia bacterium]|nr:hypothetical protein [Clostridia bacterium]